MMAIGRVGGCVIGDIACSTAGSRKQQRCRCVFEVGAAAVTAGDAAAAIAEGSTDGGRGGDSSTVGCCAGVGGFTGGGGGVGQLCGF